VFASCNNQKNVLQERQIPAQENITENNSAKINKDKLLRRQYAAEITLANSIIGELENYYSRNNSFPPPSDSRIVELEENITEKAGMVFDYVWLDTHYVLCYWLPDGTGLLYTNTTKLWSITKYIP
jgi:hypothetical protein